MLVHPPEEQPRKNEAAAGEMEEERGVAAGSAAASGEPRGPEDPDLDTDDGDQSRSTTDGHTASTDTEDGRRAPDPKPALPGRGAVSKEALAGGGCSSPDLGPRDLPCVGDRRVVWCGVGGWVEESGEAMTTWARGCGGGEGEWEWEGGGIAGAHPVTAPVVGSGWRWWSLPGPPHGRQRPREGDDWGRVGVMEEGEGKGRREACAGGGEAVARGYGPPRSRVIGLL